MRSYGRACVADFLGDFIIYRSLEPIDPRLAGLSKLRERIGLANGHVPRKSTSEYAQVVVNILKEAQKLRGGAPFERLVYIGDTRVNDGIAFTNLCQAGGWRGMAFIGTENASPAHLDLVSEGGRTLVISNRWEGIYDFDRLCENDDFPIDSRTAVVLDLDKTTLGARGRNDHVIDKLRLEAMRKTLVRVLGKNFSQSSFTYSYSRLNQPEFHAFTTDNQDYLAYICLILEVGLIRLDDLIDAVRTGKLSGFPGFLSWVEARTMSLPQAVRQVHAQVRVAVENGDPTPFKEFRRSEYQETISHMGQMDDGASAEELLQEEIVITYEVKEMAIRWHERGELLFGLSDKPDEASIPTLDLASQGYQPIHRVFTHVVGG